MFLEYQVIVAEDGDDDDILSHLQIKNLPGPGKLGNRVDTCLCRVAVNSQPAAVGVGVTDCQTKYEICSTFFLLWCNDLVFFNDFGGGLLRDEGEAGLPQGGGPEEGAGEVSPRLHSVEVPNVFVAYPHQALQKVSCQNLYPTLQVVKYFSN